jgi:hypothetical protein
MLRSDKTASTSASVVPGSSSASVIPISSSVMLVFVVVGVVLVLGYPLNFLCNWRGCHMVLKCGSAVGRCRPVLVMDGTSAQSKSERLPDGLPADRDGAVD